jgi:hypothetical protein
MVTFAQGDPNEAVRLLTEALKARPRSHEASLNLVLALPAAMAPIASPNFLR